MGAELERRGGGTLASGWERQGPHLDKQGNSNPLGEPAAQILRKSARVRDGARV